MECPTGETSIVRIAPTVSLLHIRRVSGVKEYSCVPALPLGAAAPVMRHASGQSPSVKPEDRLVERRLADLDRLDERRLIELSAEVNGYPAVLSES